MADSPRLFFALWPDADTARKLADCAPPGLDAHRRIPAEHLHLTLLFLGSLPAPLQPRIRQAAGGVRSPRFTLVLDQVGQFARAEVVWVGASVTPPELQGLARELRRGLDGIAPLERERELVPHVTLARRQRIAGKPMLCAPVAWQVEEFVLVESQPQDRANRFRTLGRWPLRP
jgi:2'-5' RNA ligase